MVWCGVVWCGVMENSGGVQWSVVKEWSEQ